MKEKMMELIEAHNAAVRALRVLGDEIQIDGRSLMKGVQVWHTMSVEGAVITEMARSEGIEAKVRMRDGEIFVN